MSDKGLLTKVVEEKLAASLDDLIKVGGVWESFDGIAFKLAISTLDDTLGEKVPEEYKVKIRDLISKIIEEEDYNTAVDMAFEFADELIDVPGLDDDMEAFIFEGMGKIAVAAIVALKKDQ